MFQESFEKKSEQIENKETENHFKFLRNENGTFGIFDNYPNNDKVLEEMSKNHGIFWTSPVASSRSKDIFPVNIDGEEIRFIAKGKQMNDFVAMDPNYPNSLPSISGFNKEEQRLNFSVMNELLINRKAQEEYKKKFGKELLVEKPVGFFISTREESKGSRWVIFEQIKNMINSIPQEKRVEFSKKEKEYGDRIYKELKEIGITNDSRGKTSFDLVSIDDMDNPSFVLVDSEDWHFELKNKG